MRKHKGENEFETDSDQNKPAEAVPQEILAHPSYQEVLQKLDESEQKTTQYWERILRMQADSENAVRRADRDLGNAHKYALEKFALELLPIVDSLELCLTSVAEKEKNAVIEGVSLTLKMFYSVMEKFGIQQVNPLSQPFNPEFEQAISVQYDPTVSPGTVLSVLQKGYTLNQRLLRPALVVVAKEEE